MKAGLWGAFSAGVFFGIGQGFAAAKAGIQTTLAKTLLHGVAGGIMQAAQGGKFGRGPVAQRCEAQPRKVRAGAQGRAHWNAEQGQRSHGFLSAGVTQFASERIGKIDPAGASGRASRIFASALVGGSVSKLTGGKFAHGAVTSAFSRGFNDEMEHGGGKKRPTEDIVVGFDGAGADDLPENAAIDGFAKSIGAKLFNARAITGGPEGDALEFIQEALNSNPSARVYLFGYSAGGAAAISLAERLAELGIPVAGLVTIDPHPATKLWGAPSFRLPTNVGFALNIYQQNPVTSNWLGIPEYPNPFLGGPVTCPSCASNPNINLTGTVVVHTNIVFHGLNNYGSEIRDALGR